MKYKLFFIIFYICSIQCVFSQIEEIKSVKSFFTRLASELEFYDTISQNDIFDNNWKGSSDLSLDLKFTQKESRKALCLKLRKSKMTVYYLSGEENCVSQKGYEKSFVNYSFKAASEAYFEEKRYLKSFEFNAYSQFFYLPLINLEGEVVYKKWDSPLSSRIIRGVKILK